MIFRINLPFLQKSIPKNSKKYKGEKSVYSFSLWQAHDPGQQEQLPPQQLFPAFFSFLIPITIHAITASNPDPTAIVPILFIKKSIMNIRLLF